MSSIKGPSSTQFDGSSLRVAIVHARWNKTVIDALLAGTISKLKACGVKDSNIIVQSVPGSFELPFACSKVIAGSHVQAATSSGDLIGLSFGGSSTSLPSTKEPSAPTSTLVNMPNAPFDAVVAIGVLIKGSTMHFEYICDSVSHALMKIQIDTGVPVIFGVLTALTEDQHWNELVSAEDQRRATITVRIGDLQQWRWEHTANDGLKEYSSNISGPRLLKLTCTSSPEVFLNAVGSALIDGKVFVVISNGELSHN